MEVNIIKEQKNPLFSRREVHISVEDMLTPSLINAKRIVSEQFKSDESLVRIRKINTSFGSKIFTIVADIYDSLEEFNRVVKKTKQEVEAEKKAVADTKAAEEEAKAAAEEANKAKEEAPAEEEKSELTEEKTE